MDGRGLFFSSLWVTQLLRAALITLAIILADARVWWWWDVVVLCVHLVILCWAHGASPLKWQRRGIVPIVFIFFWVDVARSNQALYWLTYHMEGFIPYVLNKPPPYLWEYGYQHFRRDATLWLSLNLAVRLLMTVLVGLGVSGYNLACRKAREENNKLRLPH